jgi:hypothetical protein
MIGPIVLQALNDATPWVGTDHGIADVCFHISGAWTGTIVFEACVQGQEANATPIAVSAIATPGTLVTTTTVVGLFKTNQGLAGGLKVRARLSVLGTGAATVHATEAEG